jgi:hypothetical protein
MPFNLQVYAERRTMPSDSLAARCFGKFSGAVCDTVQDAFGIVRLLSVPADGAEGWLAGTRTARRSTYARALPGLPLKGKLGIPGATRFLAGVSR